MSTSHLVNKKVEAESSPTVNNPGSFHSLINVGLSTITKARNFLISSYKTQVLFLLSQNKIVGSVSSPDWGLLLPESDGQISLVSGDFIEVLVPSTNLSLGDSFEKQLWKITELKFLKIGDLSTELQTKIAEIVLAKKFVEKELEHLMKESRVTKSLGECTDYCQECISKCNELYLHQLEASIQLKNLQFIQSEYIERLLLVLNVVNLEKEAFVNCDCYQVAVKKAQQKQQEILAYTSKLNLIAANITRNLNY